MILATEVPTRDAYERLIALDRKLKDGGDTSLHHRAINLLAACIAEGFDTDGVIIHVLLKLNF